MLLKRLNLRHDVLTLPERMHPDFERDLQRNVLGAKACKGLNAYSILMDLCGNGPEPLVVYGNLSEITKRDRYRYPRIPEALLSPALLTKFAAMGGSAIAYGEFARWLESVRRLTRYRINVLDLMHWEHRVGSWGAMSFSQYDLAFESLCPYNCRRYIETMLGVPFRYRTMPDYVLHRAMVARLWPETLSLPIMTVNRETAAWRRWIVDSLYRTGIYDVLKYLYILGKR
jgi:hypothetical protein